MFTKNVKSLNSIKSLTVDRDEDKRSRNRGHVNSNSYMKLDVSNRALQRLFAVNMNQRNSDLNYMLAKYAGQGNSSMISLLKSSKYELRKHLSNDKSKLVQRDGPQSYAPARPGRQAIDMFLMIINKNIESRLFQHANNYFNREDFRWFFAYAHAQITKQINANLKLFQRPNELIRLNMHFAEEFLRAVEGQTSKAWQRAFKICKALQKNSEENPALLAEIEWCGSAMAATHIYIDLSAALREVGCIPPTDYGNMLALVNRGMLAALVRLRGQVVGSAEVLLTSLFGPVLDLEVKTWRNAVYQQECNATVPDVESGFGKKIK